MCRPKKILICPLNWGLGHASRCVPIIYALLELNHEVIIAGNGASFLLLKQTFPRLQCIEIKGVNVRYSSSDNALRGFTNFIPRFWYSVLQDKRQAKKLVRIYGIDIIISDNRYGLYTNDTSNFIITHQLSPIVPKGMYRFQGIVNRKIAGWINKFGYCLIPDIEKGFSGMLSENIFVTIPCKRIGLLSALSHSDSVHTRENVSAEHSYILVLLSGPEPQRTKIEAKLLLQLKSENVILVRGTLACEPTIAENQKLKVIDFIDGEQLYPLVLNAKFVIAQSGYSTIMDLLVIGKKALLIPTPGQTEHEYLAGSLKEHQNFVFQDHQNLNVNEALESLSNRNNPAAVDMDLIPILKETINSTSHPKP